MTDIILERGEQLPDGTKLTYKDMGDGTHALLLATTSTNVAPTVTQATGTFSYDETDASEQDAIEVILTARAVIGSIWLDFVNVTQDTTIRAYHKIDGTNYREFQENSWLTTDSDAVLVDGFTAYRDIKITLQCTGGGAGAVDIPYAVV